MCVYVGKDVWERHRKRTGELAESVNVGRINIEEAVLLRRIWCFLGHTQCAVGSVLYDWKEAVLNCSLLLSPYWMENLKFVWLMLSLLCWDPTQPNPYSLSDLWVCLCHRLTESPSLPSYCLLQMLHWEVADSILHLLILIFIFSSRIYSSLIVRIKQVPSSRWITSPGAYCCLWTHHFYIFEERHSFLCALIFLMRLKER